MAFAKQLQNYRRQFFTLVIGVCVVIAVSVVVSLRASIVPNNPAVPKSLGMSASEGKLVSPSEKDARGVKWELVHEHRSSHAAGIDPIFFNDSENGWVLTWATLYRVSDKGKEWTPVLTNDKSPRGLYSFAFTNENTGFVVGTQQKHGQHTALVLKTSDGGKNWFETKTDVKPQADRNNAPSLLSVTLCGERDGWAVGDSLILRTANGGETWESQNAELSPEERIFTVTCTSLARLLLAAQMVSYYKQMTAAIPGHV